MAKWEDFLPPFKNMPARPYGSVTPKVLVIHQTVGDADDGSDAAALCVSRSKQGEAGTWHWTVGFTGAAYKHLDWTEEGAHDMGINSISVGIEHDMMPDRLPSEAMYVTSAHIAAAYAHAIGKKPTRRWIIGHDEDHKFGGDSTHTDPGDKWDWEGYMKIVNAVYRGEEVGALTPEQEEMLKEAFNFAEAVKKRLRAENFAGAGERVGRSINDVEKKGTPGGSGPHVHADGGKGPDQPA